MVKAAIFSILSVGIALAAPETIRPLPEGDAGVAARYPGDAGIAKDAAVLFADDFESYPSSRDMTLRWTSISHAATTRISTEPGTFLSGRKGLEFTVPRQSAEVSNRAVKRISPGRDLVFLRYYAKFDADFNVLGSSHNGSTVSANYCCPGVPSNGSNKFLVSYEAWRDRAVTANPGELNVYIYHPSQRDKWGDHFFPSGRVLPFDMFPRDFGPEFVVRPDIAPMLGRWYCYELMVQANTPGQRDGRIALWLDGDLIADFPNLKLRETAELKIDRITIDLHVKSNTLAIARKWYDNVVIATSYIGPIVPMSLNAPTHPRIVQ